MIKQGEVLQQTFLGQTFDALGANAVSKPSLQKMGPQWVLWEFLDMGIDLFSIISMSSLKNDDNDDDLDNDGEKDRRVIIVRMIMKKAVETCSTSSPCRP